MHESMLPLDLTVSEVAPLLRVKENTVREWLKAGRLRGFKTITGHWRIPRAEVDRVRGVGEEPISTEAGA